MTNTAIADTLSAHRIEWMISPTTGRIHALDVWVGPDNTRGSDWVDVTDWTSKQVYAWLGY